MSLNLRIQRIWYGGERVPISLRALVPLYRTLRAVSLLPYRLRLRRPRRLPVPVIVVGNLTAGGAGKTPLVIALVEALRARGFRPGVVSRGYGGSARGPLLLDDHPDPRHSGDEPALIRRRTRVPVAIGRDRPRAAQLLVEQGVDVVIADDGLQNPALARDVEIVVIDGERRFGNQRLLPAGPLREPLTRLASVDFRLCNGGQPQTNEIAMHLVGNIAVRINGPCGSAPLREFADQPVHAVAGIGNPQRFFDSLRAHGIEVIEHALPDHHVLAAEDLHIASEAALLMTEKDAIKCEAFAQTNHWCVPVSAEIDASLYDAVADRLRTWRAGSA